MLFGYLVVALVGYSAASPVLKEHNSKRETFYDVVGRSVFDCPRLNESCGGVPACCGRNQCYYEKGYRPFRSGKCVLCVPEGDVCQYDDNCCGQNQCDKESDWWTNGECRPPRQIGEKCWEDSQCASGSCSDTFFRASGVCEG